MDNVCKCPLCWSELSPFSEPLRPIYNRHKLGSLCEDCMKKTDSFVNYWGSKSDKDKLMMFIFVNNGIEPQRRLFSMMNAGYW